MNRKTLKLIVTICMVFFIICACTSVFATDSTTNGILDDLKNDTTASGQFNDAGKAIISWVRGIGTIVGVVVLAVLGVKYMMGSASEKAEYKKVFIPYIVGAVLLIGAVNIAGWIFGAANDLTTKTSELPTTSIVEKA